MDIKNGYFTPTFNDAVQSIKESTGLEVSLLPYPMDSEFKKYYITSDGHIFFCKIMVNKCFVIQRNHVKRKSSEKFVRISVGSGKEIHVSVAQCIYNAFVLGRWSDDRPEFKNGNKNDCTLSNLTSSTERQISTDKMYEYSDVYQLKFNNIRNHVSYKFGLSSEEAEDIVQDAYIHVCLNRSFDNMLSTWVWYCKQRAIDHIYKKDLAFSYDYDPFCFNKEFELPLYELITVKKDRDILSMYWKGYKAKEIAEIFNTSKGNVESRISRGLSKIKRIINKDIEYYGNKRHL